MSLLMDALRKAEEAKKKAALKAKSEEAAAAPGAEDQQASVVAEKTAEDPAPSSENELSMADMEEVTARSAVPNLDTPIEFEDGDGDEAEEGYVLPSSVGSTSPEDSDSETTTAAAETVAADITAFELPPEAELQQLFDEAAPSSRDEPPVSEEPVSINLDSSEAEDPNLSESFDGLPPIADPLSTSAPDSIGIDIFEDEDEEPQQPAVHEEPEHIAAPESVEAADSAGPKHLEDENEQQRESIDEEEVMPTPVMVRAVAAEASRSRVIVEKEAVSKERPKDREEPGRITARNVFAAKQSPSLSKRKIQIAAGSGLFFLSALMGAYFYVSLNQESTFNIPAGSYVASEFVDDVVDPPVDAGLLVSDIGELETTAEDSVTETVEASGLANLDVANDTAPNTSVLEELLAESEFPEVVVAPEPDRSAANIQPEILQEETPGLETVVTTIGDAAPVAIETTEPVENLPSETAPATATSPEPTNLISFQRQTNVAAVDPNLDRAYAAYQQGSLEEAEELYRRVLASDPRQRDALLGLATIAARNGNSAEALDLYSRMLARNPRDPIARAGLMELLPAASPANQEADLKRLLNEYPNVAALAYAHGNFLASNQRWSEAQQAYFRALQLAKADAAVSGRVNPDYAFNLAVSLEHLNQRESAQNYYREALTFAITHPAGFDPSAVRARLASLAGGSGNE